MNPTLPGIPAGTTLKRPAHAGRRRRRLQGTKAAILLCAILVLALGGCARNRMTEDGGRIDYARNSEFRGPHLRVFLTLEDGRPVPVNTTDDAVATRPARTPFPVIERGIGRS